MRVYSWRRVGPRRRLLIEALPGLILVISTVSVVSVKAMQHTWQSDDPQATTGVLTPEQQAAEQAKKQAEAVKKAAAAAAKNSAAKVVNSGSNPLALVIGSDPAPASQTVMTNRQMWFISTPTSDANAKELAQDAATHLQQVTASGAESLVIMEPTILGGGIVNFSILQSGGYDPFLNTFFVELKNKGVTDKSLGMWTYMPEGNMPEWGNSDPATVANCIVHAASAQKTVFPDSLASVMLNSQTYPGNDTSYSHGEYKSLLPYVQSIPKGLIDSFGYQGFPWAPPANEFGPSDLDPANYLRANLAVEAAKSLGVHSVWLNTGSPKRMYTNNASQTISFTSDQRAQILSGALAQAKAVRASGFGVAVNIFAGDKSASGEAIDWSYPAGADKQVLDNFAAQLKANGASLWQYVGN